MAIQETPYEGLLKDATDIYCHLILHNPELARAARRVYLHIAGQQMRFVLENSDEAIRFRELIKGGK